MEETQKVTKNKKANKTLKESKVQNVKYQIKVKKIEKVEIVEIKQNFDQNQTVEIANKDNEINQNEK